MDTDATSTIRGWTATSWLLLALCLACAVSLELVATRQGVGVDYDASQYLWAARSVALGNGLSTWWPSGNVARARMVAYPPLFPLTLSVPAYCGLAADQAARWENIFLLCANICLIVWMTWRITGGRGGAALFAGFLAAASLDLQIIHSCALTEPLFILTGIGGLCCLAAYLESPRVVSLLGGALLIGAAFVTRYVGASLVVTGALALLLLSGGRLRKRLTACAIFLAISCTPMLLWLARNAHVRDSPTGRHLALHFFTLWHLRTLVRTCSMWIVPLLIPPPLAIVIFLAEIAIAVFLCRNLRRVSARSGALGRILALFIACYAALLFVSICLFDASTPTSARLMSPVYVCLIPLTINSVCRLIDSKSPPLWNRAAAAVGFLLAATYLFGSLRWAIRSAEDGLGYDSIKWRQSPLIAFVRDAPPSQVIYSNFDDAIAFLTGHPAESLPSTYDQVQHRPNTDMDRTFELMHNRLRVGAGRVVLFRRAQRDLQVPETQLVARLGLVSIYSCADGTVYRLPD